MGAGDLARVTTSCHVALRKHARLASRRHGQTARPASLYVYRRNVRQVRSPESGKSLMSTRLSVVALGTDASLIAVPKRNRLPTDAAHPMSVRRSGDERAPKDRRQGFRRRCVPRRRPSNKIQGQGQVHRASRLTGRPLFVAGTGWAVRVCRSAGGC